MIRSYRWQEQLDVVSLEKTWESVVGGIIARHTTNFYVKNRILYISLDSSVMRSELHMERSNIVKQINKHLGKSFIDDVVLR